MLEMHKICLAIVQFTLPYTTIEPLHMREFFTLLYVGMRIRLNCVIVMITSFEVEIQIKWEQK